MVSPWSAAMASAIAFTAGGVLPLAAILLSTQQLRVPMTFVVVLLALAFTGVLGAKLGGSRAARATVHIVVGGALARPGTPEGVFRGNLGVVEFWVWALS
ncbi:hypothetical protein GCM10023063_24110 [Arthrobacter methylotrophus]